MFRQNYYVEANSNHNCYYQQGSNPSPLIFNYYSQLGNEHAANYYQVTSVNNREGYFGYEM